MNIHNKQTVDPEPYEGHNNLVVIKVHVNKEHLPVPIKKVKINRWKSFYNLYLSNKIKRKWRTIAKLLHIRKLDILDEEINANNLHTVKGFEFLAPKEIVIFEKPIHHTDNGNICLGCGDKLRDFEKNREDWEKLVYRDREVIERTYFHEDCVHQYDKDCESAEEFKENRVKL
jgi:hypothetical protein